MSDTTPTPPPEGSGSEPAAAPPPPPPPPPAGDPNAAGGYGQAPPPGAPGGPPPGGYAPAPGAGYGPPSTAGQPADLLMRFLARLIDFIILGIGVAIINAILFVGIFGLASGGGFGMSMGGSYAYAALSGVVGAIIYLGYFSLLESRNGQTLGKMLLKLRTEGPDGAPPSMELAIKRNFWVALGALAVIPIVGGLIGGIAELVIVIVIAVTISNSPTKQGWHDNFAGGTRVVKTA
jgi:uncharacterized RDD family membrane protein YckC